MANYAKFKMQQMGVMPIVYEPRQGAEWFEEEVCKMFVEKGLRTEIPAEYFKTEFYHDTFIDRFTEVVDVDIFDEMLTDADLQRVESILGTWEINRGKLELVEVTVSANGDDPTWVRDWTEEWLRRNEDEITTRVADLAFRMLIYEADEFNGPIFEVCLRPTDDWRWLALYAPDICRIDECTTIIYNGESTLKYLMEHRNTETTDHALWREEVIRRTANLPEGRVWRGYSDVNEAMAFTLYAIDHDWNYDQLMERIGMNTDQHIAERSLFVDGLEVQNAAKAEEAPTAKEETPTEEEAPSEEIKENQSQTTDIIDNNNPQTNTTTMEQTTAIANAIPAGWKAQPSRMDMTTEEFTSIYFDRFFKEQIAKIRIEPSFTMLDLYNHPDATKIWQAKEDGGAQVALTIESKGASFYFMYDMKNNGSRDSRAVIGGMLYQFVSLAKMGECIPQFVNITPPANVRDYIKADASVADKDSLNLNRKPKNSKPKAEQPKTEEAPKPQTAPTAKLRKEPLAQQTAPQTTEQPKVTEQPSISPAPSTTDQTYHFSGDDHYYHLYRDEDGMNGGVVIVRRDGGLNSHIKHRDFAQLSAFIASKKMTKMEQLPDALMKTLVKEGVVKALKVSEQPKSEELGVRSEELSATPQPKAEEPKQTAPTPAPKETPSKEIKGNQEQPEAKVIPFTLPGEITISNIKTGSMTLNGLTDLTAEQISIFVAGMNAMREAIRKQMTANA